ncbi:hypothetical protein GCM10027597_32290 [Saccharopolyspora tripterygii]
MPGYLACLAGLAGTQHSGTTGDDGKPHGQRGRLLLVTPLFIAGFTVVFRVLLLVVGALLLSGLWGAMLAWLRIPLAGINLPI